MTKPRLLYLLTRSERGGAATHVLQLVRHFRQSASVCLAVGEEGFASDAGRDLGVRVEILSNLVRPVSPLRDVLAIRQVTHLIDSFHPDVIHAHTAKAGFIGRVAGRLRQIPTIYSPHGWAFSKGFSPGMTFVSRKLERIGARLGRYIVVASDADRQVALESGVCRPEQLVLIPHGIPDTMQRADPGQSRRPLGVMIARLAPPKDPMLLIQALAKVNLDLTVRIVGDGPLLPAVRSSAALNDLGDRIQFAQSQDPESVLAEADFFVLTTQWESFGLAVLEAMRAGLPVVASSVGGLRELVRHGETGLLVPPQSPGALREALEELAGDATKRARFGSTGRERYEREFREEPMFAKTAALYDKLGLRLHRG